MGSENNKRLLTKDSFQRELMGQARQVNLKNRIKIFNVGFEGIKTALCEILRRRNFISSKQRVIAFSTNPREVSIAGRLHCQGKKINSIILTKMASFLQSGFCQWILWWFHEKGFISAYSRAYDLLTLIFVCEIRLVHYFLFHRFLVTYGR